MANKLIHTAASAQLCVPVLEATQIVNWSNKYIDDNDLYVDDKDPSYGRDTHSHVTLCGGLPCDAHVQVQKLASSEHPIQLTFGKLRFWNGKKYDVLYIEVNETKEMKQLRNQVMKLATNRHSPRDFHCTIAYLKKGVVQRMDLPRHENILNKVKCVSDQLEVVQRDASVLSFPLGVVM